MKNDKGTGETWDKRNKENYENIEFQITIRYYPGWCRKREKSVVLEQEIWPYGIHLKLKFHEIVPISSKKFQKGKEE